MAVEITIPRLGWSMEEGVFGEWLKAPGEFVRAGEMVFLLEGEKAAHEIESFDSGYLCVPEGAPQPGETVKVGQVIGFLVAEGEPHPKSVGPRPGGGTLPAAPTSTSVPTSRPSSGVPSASVKPSAARNVGGAGYGRRAAGPAARRLARELGIDLQAVPTPDPTGRVLCEDVARAAESRRGSGSPIGTATRSTPRARRRARELGIDWKAIRGTGRNGRVRERDILTAPAVRGRDALPSDEPAPTTPGRLLRASRLRSAIAQRMHAGVTEAAPVTMTARIDAAALVRFRESLKGQASSEKPPSYNDILIWLTARALRDRRELNACWYRDGIYQFDEVHVAVAVDTEAGLIAPVIRHADRLDLVGVAGQTRELAALGRAGKLSHKQLEGGTFTVSNLGMFGVDSFTPILNLPQAGILGVGRIVEEPVVREGRIEAGWTLTLSLTFDHRVVDGAPAARWLQHLVQMIETLRPVETS